MKSMILNKPLLATAGVAALVGLVGAGVASAVSFQGIGHLGHLMVDHSDLDARYHVGYASAKAAAISADGNAVVGQSLVFAADGTLSFKRQAYKWTREGGIQQLPLPEGFSVSDAKDVSGDGSVIVGYCNSPVGIHQEACRWIEGGGIELLGSLSTNRGSIVSRAYGVSKDGKVVVGESVGYAFRWEATTGMVNLGDLQNLGHHQSGGYSASRDGSVVVGYGYNGGSLEAMRWEASTGMAGLGVIPGGRGWSHASDVTADGKVIVGASSPDSDPYASEACLWTAESGLQRLGDLPGGRIGSRANAISADGQVIVGQGRATNAYKAVVWIGRDAPVTVRELITAVGIDLTGWDLHEAVDVSADGKVIIGTGVNPQGNVEGWIASFRDEEPPVIVEATASSNVLWPPNHKIQSIHLNALVTDDSGEAAWGVVGVECSEPGAESDMQIVDDHTVNLRATRSGKVDSRIYTIWLQAIDAAENLSEPFPVEVVVPHDQRGGTR